MCSEDDLSKRFFFSVDFSASNWLKSKKDNKRKREIKFRVLILPKEKN
ncbi:CLUMA_CG013980, isoform A [Clunio marinus]|uniref:CLUMA_CG013980, isoform A n=1 Tax=Clunio marinus TaxID=568069 RepID=A0A1J1IKG7_9DIPT|nr:CLUMA_CG013980, isoform A [Clunio marinus]